MPKVFVRSPYNYDAREAGRESALKCEDPSLAKQSFAEEVDINTIVKRFGLTGQLPPEVAVPRYGDFEDVVDFHTAMNAVTYAKQEFMQLPGALRARFHNDPQELLEFVENDANRGEAEKLGLVKPRVVEAPVEPQAPLEVPEKKAKAVKPSE